MSTSVAQGRLEVLQIYSLLQEVRGGNRQEIEKMVRRGVKNLLNLTEPQDGLGVLHLAVSAKREDLVDFLLSLGAHPNVQDKLGRTPVMLAAEMGNDPIVTLLTQKQADLRLLDAEGRGVLFYCIYPTKRHMRCLQVALQNQADVNNVSANEVHVFQVMCEKAQECTALCLLMLDAGADPNTTNQQTGMTALMEAARVGSLQLVRAILRKGGNPNARDKRLCTAAHYAAMGGHLEVIQVLRGYIADLGVVDSDMCTPLHYAAAVGNVNCCKFLAQRGCNPKLKNQEGLLPHQIAKDSGHEAAAKELKKAERKPRKHSEPGGVGLMSDLWALTLHDWSNEFQASLQEAFMGNSERVSTGTFVSVLDELNAPVEPVQLQAVISAHDKKREGFINISDFLKGVKYIKKAFLLSSYMPKTEKGEKGGKGGKKKGKYVPPLPICTLPPVLQRRRPDGGPPMFMIETYSNWSDSKQFDSDHPPQHPLINDSQEYVEKPDKVYININDCVQGGDLASLDLAFHQGVPVDVKDEYYNTPLMVACFTGKYEVVQYLLSHGADVNKYDQFLWTPLHHAAYKGQLDIVKLLVDAGAGLEHRSISGATPLMRAIESSQTSCVDFLIRKGAKVTAVTRKGQNCLQVAINFRNSEIIKLVKDRMAFEPTTSNTDKRRKDKSKYALKKSFYAVGAGLADTPTATSGKTPTQMESKSVLLTNNMITAGRFNRVDISFVPKTVWGKPPTTSQLMSKIERRRQRISLHFDFDDLLEPFSHNILREVLELTKNKD